MLGVGGPAELAAAYADLAARLGSRVLVCETVPSGVELALGVARDQALGPLIVVGAGGVLVEAIADRAVALPPVSERTARQLLSELRVSRLLAGFRASAGTWNRSSARSPGCPRSPPSSAVSSRRST